MKAGVFLSSAAHVALLTWGLVSFSAPTPLQVADVEALDIDVVPIEEFTQSVAGEKEAEFTETPAPTPTRRPDVIEEAQNVGESQNDQPTERVEEPSEQPVDTQTAAAPPPSPVPTPTPEIEPEAQPEAESVPAPTTEVAATNEDAVPVTEQPAAEDAPVSEEGEQFAALDKVQAVPTRRPEPPKPKTAKTTQRKKVDETAKTATASSREKDKSLTDDIASLLDKQEPASSGAKKSTQSASLGTSRPSQSGKLSTSEMDALRAQLATCWNVPIGSAEAEGWTASVEFDLDQNAKLIGRPRVVKSSGNRQFDNSAVIAIRKCEYKGFQLPSGKHSVWNQVQVNFDPSEMF
jgi:colicin import membrane protein